MTHWWCFWCWNYLKSCCCVSSIFLDAKRFKEITLNDCMCTSSPQMKQMHWTSRQMCFFLHLLHLKPSLILYFPVNLILHLNHHFIFILFVLIILSSPWHVSSISLFIPHSQLLSCHFLTSFHGYNSLKKTRSWGREMFSSNLWSLLKMTRHESTKSLDSKGGLHSDCKLKCNLEWFDEMHRIYHL